MTTGNAELTEQFLQSSAALTEHETRIRQLGFKNGADDIFSHSTESEPSALGPMHPSEV